MKLFLSLLFLAVFAQDTTRAAESSFATITGIIDYLIEGLRNFFASALNDVANFLSSLDSAISNMANGVLGTVSGLVDNLVSSIEALLAEARRSEKILDDCVSRVTDLEHLKPKTSGAVEMCRKNLTAEMAIVSGDLTKEQDRGKDVISFLTKSLKNCLKGSLVGSCISNAQQSAFQAIQDVVTNAQVLRQKMSLASEGVANCLNDVEENGRNLANQIYQEIQSCISQAPLSRK